MRTRRTLSRRLAASASAAGCLAALALLWQLRPQLPHGAALDSVFAGELLRLLLWLTLALLVLVLLARVLRAGTRSARADDWRQRVPSRRRSPPAPLLDIAAREERAGEPQRWVPSWRRPQLMLVAVEPHEYAPPKKAAAVELLSAPVVERTAERVQAARAQVLLLGPLEIPSTAHRRRRAPGPAHELIAYLALHPDGASRDELLEALWPNQNPARSEQRFWQASKEARKLLDGGIVRDSGRYRLDREQVDVDADALERLLAGADDAGDELAEQELLEQALSLFRGDPLEGCDFLWSAGPVRRLAARRLELLERAARARLANSDARGALDAAEAGIAADELNERFWQVALEAEAATGARDAVAQRYDELAHLLDERLGLKPSAETRAVYLRLLGPDD